MKMMNVEASVAHTFRKSRFILSGNCMKMMNIEASVAHTFRKANSSSLVGARGFNGRLFSRIQRLTIVNLA